MEKNSRVIVLLVVLASLFLIYWIYRVDVNLLKTPGIVIFSALVMMAFSMLMLEHYFTRPTDVIANTTAALLLLVPVGEEMERLGIWYWILIGYSSLVLVVALISLVTLSPSQPPDSLTNRISKRLKAISVSVGNAKVVWFSVFASSLFAYVEKDSHLLIALFFVSGLLLALEPKKISLALFSSPSPESVVMAKIFGVQSGNVYLARVEPFFPMPKRFDFVQFNNSEKTSIAKAALVIDSYVLDEQRWIRFLNHSSIEEMIDPVALKMCSSNTVEVFAEVDANPLLARFVGVVREDSTVDRIRFDYSEHAEVSEGAVLTLLVGSKEVFYQVVDGFTATEILELKNEAGFVIGEAIQLGTWNGTRQVFEKFGWLPNMNTPIFLAEDEGLMELPSGETKIGQLPGTKHPISIDLDIAVTHHLAILGVTGSGKSVFARQIVRDVMKLGTKVVCVDFTGEYTVKLTGKEIQPIVDINEAAEIMANLEFISNQLDEFANKRDKKGIENAEHTIGRIFYSAFEKFFKSDSPVALFALPDVTNSTVLFDYTRWFFKILFRIAKQDKCFGARVCIVLEEAHTIIPEWNFLGIEEKRASALVNSIGQIALQGRKYGVGFIIVAQRTANVSKTVLTQCNSIVAFQQFDRTSAEFLANYMGGDFLKALSRLRPRTAVAVGKAFRGGIPMIFEVPEIVE